MVGQAMVTGNRSAPAGSRTVVTRGRGGRRRRRGSTGFPGSATARHRAARLPRPRPTATAPTPPSRARSRANRIRRRCRRVYRRVRPASEICVIPTPPGSAGDGSGADGDVVEVAAGPHEGDVDGVAALGCLDHVLLAVDRAEIQGDVVDLGAAPEQQVPGFGLAVRVLRGLGGPGRRSRGTARPRPAPRRTGSARSSRTR